MPKSKFEFEALGGEFAEYLQLKSKSTAAVYKWGLKYFVDYYKAKYGNVNVADHFLSRYYDNLKQKRPEARLIEKEFVGFIDYLHTFSISDNSIRVYCAALQNFFKYHNIPVSVSFVGNWPPPIAKKINNKHEWSIEQIKSFVNAASTYRDKAAILCLFQSGVGVSELVGLNYGDVKEDLEKDVVPIHLDLVRKKTQLEYRTFFGYDATKYLKAYLETRSSLSDDSPLFSMLGNEDKRITCSALEMRFKAVANKLDFIKQSETGYNPARPHSLRAAFNSRLMGKIDGTLREFWMGHSVGEQKKTYLTMPLEEMRELYMDAEKYLAVEQTSRKVSVEKKVGGKASAELIDTVEKQGIIVSNLAAEVKKLRQNNTDLTERLNKFELVVKDFLGEYLIKEVKEYVEKKRSEEKTKS